jgi:hypothetical protein
VNLSIRAAEPGDLEPLRRLYKHLNPIDAPLPEALAVERWKAMLAHPGFTCLVAKQMRDALESHDKVGEYASITDGDAFAAQLTKDLQAVSHDLHLNVAFSPFKVPEPQTSSADDTARMREGMKRSNCAFDKVEVLSGNIGYVKFNAFMNPGVCGPTVVAAMGFLANTDSVIFDLRDNGGGDPAMVTFIASYLFDKPTHLNDLYNRKEDSTQQFWTLAFVPGERLAKQSVFVLTSSADVFWSRRVYLRFEEPKAGHRRRRNHRRRSASRHRTRGGRWVDTFAPESR